MEHIVEAVNVRYDEDQYNTTKRGRPSKHILLTVPATTPNRVALVLVMLLVSPAFAMPISTSTQQPHSKLSAPLVPSAGALCSASSCEDLGWTNAASFGSSTVCGGTKAMTGACPVVQGWDAANAFCEAAGARLCSASELEADEARDAGCDYNNQLVWSGTSCSDGNGFEVTYGAVLSRNAGKQCIDRNDVSTAAVRCCADASGSCQASTPLEHDKNADVRNLNYYYASYYAYEDDTGPGDDGTAADIIDNFNSFDDGLWNAQCSGCTFVDGSLFINGDSQLMRTYERIADISRIKGTLVKNR